MLEVLRTIPLLAQSNLPLKIKITLKSDTKPELCSKNINCFFIVSSAKFSLKWLVIIK